MPAARAAAAAKGVQGWPNREGERIFMKAVLIPGDGIGREIAESVRAVSAALNTGIDWQECEAGAEYAEVSGELIAPGTLDAIEACGWALKGPTATPIGKGFRSINVQLRQRFATYANLRPVHTLPGVPTRFENVDLVIVRENTEDLYKGIEYMLTDEIANGVKLITRPACEKICRFAFDYARKNGRKKVTAVHKANIMKLTDGLFLRTFREVAEDYPEITADDCIIDALCMKLVQKPEQFDVLVAPNLYGDIISDLCAGLVGGLGFAPSANIGDKTRIYEAVHGSAPILQARTRPTPALSPDGLCHDAERPWHDRQGRKAQRRHSGPGRRGQGRHRRYRRHGRHQRIYTGGHRKIVIS